MPPTRGLTLQSIPFASIVGCLVALDRAPWRSTASSAGIVGHRASEAHGTPLMAQYKGHFDGASRTRTGGLLGAIPECACCLRAAFSALEGGTRLVWSGYCETQTAVDIRRLPSIWAPKPAECPFTWPDASFGTQTCALHEAGASPQDWRTLLSDLRRRQPACMLDLSVLRPRWSSR
jgi:hypothetical protein